VTEPNVKDAGYRPDQILIRADEVILPHLNGNGPSGLSDYSGPLRVGVDLGTAYTVMAVLDEKGVPLVGEYQFAQVVRDGLVVDFMGAVKILEEMKLRIEAKLGRNLTHAASGFPPGIPGAEVRATANVVEAAGMQCSNLIDEPSAANNVLKLNDGAIVDIGGGTTGIAILADGEVVYRADEPTGGTHISLVIAGASDLTFEEAEALKKDPSQQSRLFPIVRPVMEKMGTIIERHIRDKKVQSIILVGGTPLFPRIDEVIQEITGIPTRVPAHPLFVTPVGIALEDKLELD
jgi:ethanolamine utilization protein EutJ